MSAVSAQISTLDTEIFAPLRSTVSLDCRFVGEPFPTKKWFLNGREETWIQDLDGEKGSDMFNGKGGGDLELDSVTKDSQGNYTCYVENRYGSDSVTYKVNVQGTYVVQGATSSNALFDICMYVYSYVTCFCVQFRLPRRQCTWFRRLQTPCLSAGGSSTTVTLPLPRWCFPTR